MTKEKIQKCIDLLNTDGINSKEQVKKILQGELKSIKETSPSEALECLERVEEITEAYSIDLFSEFALDLENIKQALLKVPEPKHYLKWEDLEFKKDIKVKLNGEEYLIYFDKFDGEDMVDAVFLNLKENKVVIRLSNGDKSEEQFFNDLHLERVEE